MIAAKVDMGVKRHEDEFFSPHSNPAIRSWSQAEIIRQQSTAAPDGRHTCVTPVPHVEVAQSMMTFDKHLAPGPLTWSNIVAAQGFDPEDFARLPSHRTISAARTMRPESLLTVPYDKAETVAKVLGEERNQTTGRFRMRSAAVLTMQLRLERRLVASCADGCPASVLLPS